MNNIGEGGLNSTTGSLLASTLVCQSWRFYHNVKWFLYTVLQLFLCGCFHSALHSRLSKWGKMCGCQQMHVCWWVAGGPVPDRWEHTGSICICPSLHHWKQDFRAHLRHFSVDLQETNAAVALLPVVTTSTKKWANQRATPSYICFQQSQFSVRNRAGMVECAWASTGVAALKDLRARSVKRVSVPRVLLQDSLLCLSLLTSIFFRPVAVTTPCVPPCQHGATCSPHNTCTCPEGTAGLRCERLWVCVFVESSFQTRELNKW